MRRWLIWGVVVAAWTVALELPVPISHSMPGGEFILTYRFMIAKSMHVGFYAGLTILSAWVPLQVRYRSAMMFFLMGHAMLTELLQKCLHEYFHRGGSLEDVAFDHLGIAIGFALSWKWWTRADV